MTGLRNSKGETKDLRNYWRGGRAQAWNRKTDSSRGRREGTQKN